MEAEVVRALSGAFEETSDDSGAYTAVKCRLNSVIKDKKLLPVIEEAVSFYTRISVWSSRLLTLHVLRLMEEGKPIPRLNTGYLGRVIRCCSYSDISSLRKLDVDLASSRKRFFELLGDEVDALPKGVPRRWRPRLIDELAKQFKTAIVNSVETRLWRLLKRWFYSRIRIEKPEEETSGIFVSFCNVLFKDEKPLSTWSPYVRGLFEQIQSFGLDWKEPTPEAALPVFRQILQDMERDEDCRLFSILPLYGTGTKHVPISTSVLVDMARAIGGGDKSKTEERGMLWERLFNVKAVSRGAKKFAFRLTTNGADCSVLFHVKKPPLPEKKEVRKIAQFGNFTCAGPKNTGSRPGPSRHIARCALHRAKGLRMQ